MNFTCNEWSERYMFVHSYIKPLGMYHSIPYRKSEFKIHHAVITTTHLCTVEGTFQLRQKRITDAKHKYLSFYRHSNYDS